MKKAKYYRRFLYDWFKSGDLHHTQISAKETELQVFTSKKADRGFIENRIRHYRIDIENYIERNRAFLVSLKPVDVEHDAPAIIREMALQSKKINCGPMTTIAGAIAYFLGRDLVKKGYRDLAVQNGGAIFLKTSKLRGLGFYAGRSKLWSRLKLKINPRDTPLGVAISSGTMSESASFGCADSVIVLSKSVVLAEGISIAAANRINSKEDLQKALDFARKIKGIQGIAIVLKNNLTSWGKIEFIK